MPDGFSFADATQSQQSSANDLGPVYEDAGRQYGQDPNLLRAQTMVESSDNDFAVSPSGALGRSQFIPSTAKATGLEHPFDPHESIYAQAKLNRENMDRFGSPSMAIMAYHGGTDARQWGPKTQDYLQKVADTYARLKPQSAQQPAGFSFDDARQPAAPPSAGFSFEDASKPLPMAKTEAEAPLPSTHGTTGNFPGAAAAEPAQTMPVLDEFGRDVSQPAPGQSEVNSRVGAVLQKGKEAYQGTPEFLTPMAQKWADDHGVGGDARVMHAILGAFNAVWMGSAEAANQIGQTIGLPLLGRDAAAMIESAGMTGAPHAGGVPHLPEVSREIREAPTPPPAQSANLPKAAEPQITAAQPKIPEPFPMPEGYISPTGVMKPTERPPEAIPVPDQISNPPFQSSEGEKAGKVEMPPRPTRLRTVEQIQNEDSVGPKAAAAIQAQEIEAIGRPVTTEEVAARKAGIDTSTARQMVQPETPEPVAPPLEFVHVPPEPERLATFLRRQGGVQDPGGDILSSAGGVRGRPGLVNNRSGMSINDAMMKAQEAGYFPEIGAGDTRDERALIDKLHDDLNDRPVYSQIDDGTVYAREQALAQNNEIMRQMAVGAFPDEETIPFAKKPMDDAAWQAFLARGAKTKADAAAYAEAGKPAAFKEGQRTYFVSKDLNYPPDGWRITMFDSDGQPSGHLEAKNAYDAFREVLARSPERIGPNHPEEPQFARKAPLPPQTGTDMFGIPAKEPPQPRVPEPTIKGDTRQTDMFGKDDAAIQAQAQRDQQGRGGLEPTAPQQKADEGLFAPKEPDQGAMFAKAGPSVERPPQEALDAMVRATEKIVGRNARVELYDNGEGKPFTVRQKDGTEEQVQGYTLGSLIRVALDDNSQHFLDHESLHALRNMGVFTPQEWLTLLKTAEREGWADKPFHGSEYSVRSHYPDVKPNVLLEEGAAEAFGRHMRGEPTNTPFMQRMLNKVRQFFARLRNALQGQGFQTAEDVFAKVKSGEIGAREQGSGTPTRGPMNPNFAAQRAASFHPDLSGDVSQFARRPQGQGQMPLGSPIRNADDFADRLRRIPRIGAALATAAEKLTDFGDQVRIMTVPMTSGANEAKAMAKDYMNAKTLARHEGGAVINWLANEFKPDRLKEMWNRADAESVAAQTGNPAVGVGLDQLAPRERAVVEQLQATANAAFAEARRVGVHDADGLPSYVPRMVMDIGAPEGGAHVVRDIRTLALATMRLQEATQGRILINRIREAGQRAGRQTVQEGGVQVKGGPGKPLNPFGQDLTTTTAQLRNRKYLTTEETEAAAKRVPGDDGTNWFTIPENGSFYTSRFMGTDAQGNPVIQRVPIYVRGDFEGPLRAVMAGKSGAIYRGMMDLKGRMMTSIMYGVAHLGVIAGRAFPAAPNLIRLGMEGNAFRNDPGSMRRAVLAGMRPIGRQFGFQDISSFEQEPRLTPGRSWTSQVLAAVPGLFDPRAGEAVKRAVDTAGHFMHNTLLWDRVADLQAGLFTHYEREQVARGSDPQSAARAAANLANIYAGSLPREAMSNGAAKIANTLLFSRSYRFGTAAAVKAAIVGLPQDMKAQIERDRGVQALMSVTSNARKAAIGILATDLAMYYVGKAVLQSTANVMLNNTSLDDEGKGYIKRFMGEIERLVSHPLENMNPFSMLESLSPTGANEPGKQNRILVGYEKDGTGIYVRPVVGKSAEDITDYFTQLRQTLLNMESPFMRPVQALVTNESSPGTKVYDPYAPMPVALGQAVKNLGKVAAGSVVPSTAIGAFYKILTGQGGAFEAAQIAGGGLGFSVSHGFPGGPAEAERYAGEQSHQFQVRDELASIRAKIKAGQIGEAQKAMTDLNMLPAEQKAVIHNTLNPRASGRSVQKFEHHATPEQIQRFQQDITAKPPA